MRKILGIDPEAVSGGCATITEFYATDGPWVRHVRKFEIRGLYQPSHDDLDMREAKELFIYYIKPRKRTYESPIRLLHGTAYAPWSEQPRICYDNNHYVLIEHNGKVLFDSRDVFPCDMQEFDKRREDYVAQMAARGFPRESLNLSQVREL
ncbi:MAG TPA: hypothetical protein VM822_23305 [Pseudolabrys sp.]|jgi:hypothetical protein|nr:hypothetical protein [Pseudolabrys sp.]